MTKRIKILFIMFQGSGTNQKTWNEHTKSKFLDRLKIIGSVYCYQDKTYNIWHYNKSFSNYKDYDMDIDIDLSYVKPNKYIKMIYDNICKKYKNIDEYKFIPIGFSAGGSFALYFAQLYSSQCIHVILLDPDLHTPNNMKKRLKMDIDDLKNTKYPITNAQYKKLLQEWKTKGYIEDANKINNINHYIRSLFFSKHLKLQLSVPTLAFVNIQEPEGNILNIAFTNKLKLEEVNILEKHNNYKAIIFTNKTHYIFNMIQPANIIIKEIKSIIRLCE